MQAINIIEAMSIIQWLFGFIIALLGIICIIGGYFLKKIHDTFVNDHEITTKDHEIIKEIRPMVIDHEKKLTKLITEHEIRHQ